VKRKPKKRDDPRVDAIGLRTILDAMVEAVFIVDDKGRIALTNRALDELLERDARGSRPKKLIRSEQLRIAVRRARKQRAATEVEVDGTVGERSLTFRAQVSPLPSRAGVVVVLHDVTALKEADRVRRDLVANAAHELRTPLTAIRGYAESLARGAIGDAEVSTVFMQGILRQTKRLQRLAEDLALLARAESAEHGYEAVDTDVCALSRECAATLAALAAEKEVRVAVHAPAAPVVMAISARALEEVLVNLLENAIKHSRAGGEVALTVRAGEGSATFEVRDAGVGIDPSLHRRIFERFFRVDAGRSRNDGGSGLGLAIVRHLVNRMGGNIEVESALGQGALFRVVVPAR
jgi:two-component system phosphate regulon sensor histidine kinase PhoR